MTTTIEFAEQILHTIVEHRRKYRTTPSGEIHLSLRDAQLLSDESQFLNRITECSNAIPRMYHIVKDGDTGSLWGMPFVVDKTIKEGTVFIGYKIQRTDSVL